MNQQIKDLEERLYKIKKELESLKQLDWLNKWVVTENGSIYFITNITNENCYGYGFWFLNGEFRDPNSYVCAHSVIKRLATNQEVEEMLKNEAIKIGFKEGIRFTSLPPYGFDYTLVGFSGYNLGLNSLLVKARDGDGVGVCAIFKDGVWAEIINKKKMTLKEIEKELGYEIELI